MRYLLLLFLYGCTSSTPRLLADGAPLAPPEPRVTYTPTGAGLSEYWGTPEAPKVERSPHKRVLPPTKEPGLWAGDQPRAVQRPPWADTEPRVLGVELPLLDEFPDDHPMQQVVRRCAYYMDIVTSLPPVDTYITRLSGHEQRCYVAKMYDYCAQREVAELEKADASSAMVSHDLRVAILKNARSADGLRFLYCLKAFDTDPVNATVAQSLPLWKQYAGRSNVYKQ